MADWEWSFGINVLGVIHGIREFLPQMIARGSGYIINTPRSLAWLPSPARCSLYRLESLLSSACRKP